MKKRIPDAFKVAFHCSLYPDQLWLIDAYKRVGPEFSIRQLMEETGQTTDSEVLADLKAYVAACEGYEAALQTLHALGFQIIEGDTLEGIGEPVRVVEIKSEVHLSKRLIIRRYILHHYLK